MLDGLAPARRRQALGLIGAALVAVLALAAWLVVRQVGSSGVADQATPGPVVVIPGYGGDLSDLDPLVAELRREGRRVVVFRPTDGGTGDLRVQARRLADLVERTRGDGSVDLVGYSAGGVVARLYVRDEGGAAVVRRVLTLGSPHHGTDVATLAQDVGGGCPTACEQLATDSDLVRQLNAGDETPAGPRWATVRTREDTIVTPSTSAGLAGALNVVVQDLCPGATTTHGQLPGDPVTLAALRSALGRTGPARPSAVACG